jgi:hypothetical protein
VTKNGRQLLQSERPSYGMMGFKNHLEYGGTQYGESYFIMKENVKSRATFHFQNSSSVNGAYTKADLFHSVKTNPDDNVSLLRGILTEKQGYNEVQIWGGVNLSDDVTALVLDFNDVVTSPMALDDVIGIVKKNKIGLKVKPLQGKEWAAHNDRMRKTILDRGLEFTEVAY